MKDLNFNFIGFDLRVLAALAALAALLGILNNLRVHEEKRLAWLGGVPADETENRP